MSALRAEWTKARTLAGTWWLLLAVIALTTAVGGGAAIAVTCHAAGCDQDPARITLSGIDLSQAVVAILAALTISGPGHLVPSHERRHFSGIIASPGDPGR